ncbi:MULTISPECIES: hypothetical protein [Mangrovimonas]|uniref:Uncharacterized protein n=1 Tax=Mangrovimonas yunxiaonensis TaxID=1197477 RepID=A0A084TMW1_9FLAO|nr:MULTISPECIES: hypothetical protein [Mangrovimonas]KFB02047.1 hypothetical protein IA57_04080 [Mangrovimonas yunxiaonensis]GGH45527.1 hypothetical protein GCM10011364_19010 [Mangrovimonas yunxiaonensis]
MRILDWIKNREVKSEFEKAFSDLKRMGEIEPSAKRTYELLRELDFDTSDSQSELLISEFNKIQYQSNTNSFFYFYFPIVTHILHYKPKYEKDILGYLIGPNFANGDTETKDLIPLIKNAMEFKLTENKNYLTKESKSWILNELPKMEKEVEREVQKCWKELNE